MLRTFYLDLKDASRTVKRFEVRFVLDDEAIQHGKELAAQLIAVLDQSGRKIHDEPIYPDDEQGT
jgi:hypothetical protein